jgi:hypothetical protein
VRAARERALGGARFKKAMSPREETAILRGWNIDPASV